MYILYVRRIRNISNDRVEEVREERQLWGFRAWRRMAKLQGLAV